MECNDCRVLMDSSAQFACALEQGVVEKTSLNRDESRVAWKICSDFLSANRDEIDGVNGRVWPSSDFIAKAKPLQDWQARRIDTIAANLFARKFFALD